MASASPAPPAPGPQDDAEYFVVESQMDRVEREKREALKDPGPTWREWWFYSASKWYMVLLFLILDAWIVSAFLEVGALLFAALGTMAAIYLEFLFYQYLYYEPALGQAMDPHDFRRDLLHPVAYGRWTPEGHLLRSGGHIESDAGPDPRKIL